MRSNGTTGYTVRVAVTLTLIVGTIPAIGSVVDDGAAAMPAPGPPALARGGAGAASTAPAAGDAAGASAGTSAAALQGQDIDPAIFGQLTYRHIGPVGNRVSAVVGVPGDPNTYYAGAASGGVWKTTDGGVDWEPVFDGQPVQSIGALAVAPSNPNIVWAGTGETFIRSNVLTGDGVYKSVDAGKTWRHMGLPESGRIGRIVIHPEDPDIVFAAVMGHCYGPQRERGVYKTTDGGASWEQVLFVDEDTGASDIVMDPNNPEILFAGLWPMQIWTWGRRSGGPGGGIWRSKDGGDTWEELTAEGRRNGLPRKPLGKIGLGMSPDDSNRVYALIETASSDEMVEVDEHQGVLWRSDDGGDGWRMVNGDHTLAQRPLYYTRLAVAPDDADEVHFMSTRHSRSLDGGVTTEGGGAGGDNHDMWIDPLLPDRMIVGNDGGVSISTTRGASWFRPQLPIAQMYHVFVDNQVPYYVMGNRQDGPSARGPSRSLSGGSIDSGQWHGVGGCESGFAIPDPVEPNIIWSGCYDSILEVYDADTGYARNVTVWPDNPEGWAAADLRYRFQWTFPIHISPHDHDRVYAGSQVVHMTTNRGQSWTVISPDLTTDDESKQQKMGGLTYDDTSPTYAAVLFAIAESPLEEGVIYAGSNDGLLHVTRDGGDNWTNVTGNIPDLPEWGTVSNIEPSRHDAGTVYVAVDFHQVGIFEPHLYKSTDYGQSWEKIVGGIPDGPLSYTHVIREDPQRPGLLYAGTANAVYVSFDDGGSWVSLQSNLPHAPVHWLTIQDHFNDLVVGTYGRGFWIMDDITPLQQLTADVMRSGSHLFDIKPAYRFRNQEGSMAPNTPAAGRNPPYGASINYWVGEEGAAVAAGGGRRNARRASALESSPPRGAFDASAASPNGTGAADSPGGDGVPGSNTGEALRSGVTVAPSGPTRSLPAQRGRRGGPPQRGGDARIEILKDGEVVRTLSGPTDRGINRVWWDLRYESSERAVLRSEPPEHSHFELSENGTRSAPDGGSVSPLAPPGEYTVRLTVGDEQHTGTVTVLKDPHAPGTQADIEAQFEVILALRDDVDTLVGLLQEAEAVRAQIRELDRTLREIERLSAEERQEIRRQGREIDQKLVDLEMKFTDLRLNGGQDSLRYGRQLYAKMTSLAGYIGSSDYRPTDQHMAVFEMYQEMLGTYEDTMAQLRRNEIAAFNRLLEEKGLGVIITRQ